MTDINNLTVKEVKNFISTIDHDTAMSYLERLLNDPRKSVVRIGEKLKKSEEDRINERKRIASLWTFEKKQYPEDLIVAGVDEVGRGPLAGPVVCAAVILKKDTFFKGLKDSKQVKKTDRERLFDEINDKAIAVGIGICDEKIIDDINILEATKLGMVKAIDDLDIKPEFLLIDALEIDALDYPQKGIIKGDDRTVSIAAASIIAKVTRDRLMYKYHKKYPEYGFDTNVGYGTKVHRDALKKYGKTPIHRTSFIKNLI